NFGDEEVSVPLEIEFAADYADIFEVRGLERPRRGLLLPPEVGTQEVVLAYEGLDGTTRRTRVHSSMRPTTISADRMCFELTLSPGAEASFFLTISCEFGGPTLERRTSYEEAERKNRKALASLARDECRIHTANEQFNDWIARSLADLRMLATPTEHGLYPYAGVPWYSTIFGRDRQDRARGPPRRDGRAQGGSVRPVLRYGRRDAALRHARGPLLRATPRPRASQAALAAHRACAHVDRSVRRPGRRRLRRVLAQGGAGAREPGLEGLVRQHIARGRLAGSR